MFGCLSVCNIAMIIIIIGVSILVELAVRRVNCYHHNIIPSVTINITEIQTNTFFKFSLNASPIVYNYNTFSVRYKFDFRKKDANPRIRAVVVTLMSSAFQFVAIFS